MGRATQGVRLINLREDDSIAAVAKVMKEEDDLENIDIMNMDVKAEENPAPENDGTALDEDSPETEVE